MKFTITIFVSYFFLLLWGFFGNRGRGGKWSGIGANILLAAASRLWHGRMDRVYSSEPDLLLSKQRRNGGWRVDDVKSKMEKRKKSRAEHSRYFFGLSSLYDLLFLAFDAVSSLSLSLTLLSFTLKAHHLNHHHHHHSLSLSLS